MPSPESASNLLFWIVVFFTVAIGAFLFAIVKVVAIMVKQGPTHHPQITGHGGTNNYDASSTSKPTFTNNGEINIGVPRLPKIDRHPDEP